MLSVEFSLPLGVISRADVTRVKRELSVLNDFFASAANRSPGTPVQLPRVTRILEQLTEENKLSLLNEKDRAALLGALDTVLKQAPQMHISFASEPSPKALERILLWFRQNIHTQALLQIGLQPAIAAGCVLRTPNRVFDLSMRASLYKQVPYLTQLIDGAVRGS